MKPAIGTQVFIENPDHPWYTYAGEIISKDYLPVLQETKYRIRLKNGQECYCDASDFKPL